MITEPFEKLRKFSLFEDFSHIQGAYIKQNGKQLEVLPEQVLLKLGAEHHNILLLLEGELKLTASDGMVGIISADSHSSAHPIAQLRPSRYQVVTNSKVKILVLAAEVLDKANALMKANGEVKN